MIFNNQVQHHSHIDKYLMHVEGTPHMMVKYW